MREIGHLVGHHDPVDDRRSVGCESFVDLGLQLSGLSGAEAMAPSGRSIDSVIHQPG
jgi:hypothetical protein